MREILPENIIITQYSLELLLDPNKPNFTGVEDIILDVVIPTKVITLNSKNLEISWAQLGDKIPNITYDTSKDQVMFNFDEILPVDSYILTVNYSSTLSSNMVGLYISKDKEFNSLVTQFEAIDARRALICADEPNKKAIFDITLIVPKEYTALSNMHVIFEIDDEAHILKKIHYANTPVMSTYLLALFVGKVEYIENIVKKTNSPNSNSITKIRVYAPTQASNLSSNSSNLNKLQFALDTATKVVSYLENYFHIDYPLKKLDLLAVSMFSSGAMENWGLITFRSRLLLVDENTTLDSKINIAYIIAHEIAHQWFGNLVTMDWWDDLWLNEGFATWMGYDCIDHLFPEWKVWETFIIKEYYPVLELDSLVSSHSIQNKVEKPSEIDEIFDKITYSKGCCIIRMLENYMGRESFRSGIQEYLIKFQYKNATTANLWESLSKSSKKDITGMIDNWVKQPNYPIVTLSRNKGFCIVPNDLVITQKNILNFTSNLGLNSNILWTVPMLSKKQILNDLTNSSSGIFIDFHDFVKLNRDQIGFYRVHYEEKNILEMLKKSITSNNTNTNTSISAIDRSEIINNMFDFSRFNVNNCNITNYLDFLSCYIFESTYIVYSTIIGNINQLCKLFTDTPTIVENLKLLRDTIRVNIFVNLERFDKNESKKLSNLHNALSIDELMPGKEALDMLIKFSKGDSTAIEPEQRVAIFTKVLETSSSNFELLVDMYTKTTSGEIQQDILTALSTTSNQEVFKKTLEFAYKFNKVKDQDSYRVLCLGSSTQNKYLCLNYLIDNWDMLYSKFKDNTSLFGHILSGLLENIFDTSSRKKLFSFLQSKDLSKFSKTINQSKEKGDININFITRDKERLENWLDSKISRKTKKAKVN